MKKLLEETLHTMAKNLLGWHGSGGKEEVTRAEWMRAAQSQPGSFTQLGLNNFQVLVSCVNNTVCGCVSLTGERVQRFSQPSALSHESMPGSPT